MQYSLLARFRGALLGSWLGEILGGSTKNNSGVLWHRLHLKKVEISARQDEITTPQETISNWSKIANSSIASLISRGNLNREDWLEVAEKENPSLLLLKGKGKSHEVAIANLPIALFFHDNPVMLAEKLEESGKIWLSDMEDIEGLYSIAFAIALILTENFNPTTLIPQILTKLKSPQTPLAQLLEQVQTLLEQRADLETTVIQLRQGHQHKQKNCPNTTIALAFYCFLYHPEDFRLTVTRALRSGYQPQITAAIAGALSGAYNSMMGIPVGWRVAAQRISLWQNRQQLASRLFALWSGVWDVNDIEEMNLAAVAGVGIIQSRL
ncbi:MAG TPA: ADP-ribosylglycohydrolase family protein [Cyanobacteria bacterium UBA11149]|nr:ADP-ribosylglycohydrolase family protein [Cyanobacteria bacterium UBA11149]